MKFAAVIEYPQDPDRVQAIRPVHRQYLAALKERGQLVLAGPFTDGSGALIVYEAASADEAESFLRADPFHQNGIFLRWVLRPWNPVLANHPLLPA